MLNWVLRAKVYLALHYDHLSQHFKDPQKSQGHVLAFNSAQRNKFKAASVL